MLYTHEYWLQPYEKNLEEAADTHEEISMKECIVALVHVEPRDLETAGKTTTKALKHLKWLARKSDTENIVLHSFAHLAGESAAPKEAQSFLEDIRTRLTSSGFTVCSSPFGYFNEFKLHVAGPSLAKVFVDI